MNLPQSHGVTEINILTQKIIGCAIVVHRALGPGLLESIYGWQVLDRVLKRAADHIESLRGRIISRQGIVCLTGVASEEILILEPDCPDGGEISPDSAARIATAVASSLDEIFHERAFASMTPKLHFRAGWAMIEENPNFRFERIVHRAIEVARGQKARREDRRRAEWGAELRRVIRDVREDGDNAIRFYNIKFDNGQTSELRVTEAEERRPGGPGGSGPRGPGGPPRADRSAASGPPRAGGFGGGGGGGGGRGRGPGGGR